MAFGGFLKQSTAVDILLGPFVDSTDGDTEETGLTINAADVRLSKNGQTGAAKNDATACAHDADGFYNCEFDATDTNTVGQLTVYVHVAGALAVRMDYQIVEESIYDALFGAAAGGFDSNGRVDVGEWLGTAVTLSTNNRPNVNADEWNDVLLSTTNPLPNAAADAAGGLPISDAGGLNLDSMNSNVDAILLDTGTTLPATLSTIDGNVDAILVDTGTTLPALLPSSLSGGRMRVAVEAIVGTALSETNAGDLANSFSFFFDVNPTTTKTVDDVGVAGSGLTQQNVRDAMKLAPSAGAAAAGSIDEHLDDVLTAVETSIPATLTTIDGNVDAILIDTGTTLPATLSTIDGNVDAILVDTGTTLPALLPSSLSGGRMRVAVEAIVGTALSETNAGDLANSFSFFFDVNPTTTKTVDDVGVAGSGLTQQNVRDAMKLAPSAGAAAAGSVDEHLDDVLTAVETSIPATLTTIDGNVDAILIDTGTTLPATLTTIDGNVDAILIDTGTTLPALLGTPAGADLAADIAAIKADSAAILVDTGTTLPATLATIDANVDAILIDTGVTLPATLATIDGNVDAILLDTGTTLPATLATLPADVWTQTLTESYAADGAEGTGAQLLYLILSNVSEYGVVGTLLTTRRLDGATTAATYRLDDATAPSDRTRES